jgi:hydrogenase maturation protease
MEAARTLVVGVGSEWRGDDGVGPAVARRAFEICSDPRRCEWLAPLDSPLELFGRWDGADLAVVVDATSSGAKAGSFRVIDLWQVLERDRAARTPAKSTHGMDVFEVLRLSDAIGRGPARAVLVGIEGEDFGHGTALTPAVRAAVEPAAATVVDIVETAARRSGEGEGASDGEVSPCA